MSNQQGGETIRGKASAMLQASGPFGEGWERIASSQSMAGGQSSFPQRFSDSAGFDLILRSPPPPPPPPPLLFLDSQLLLYTENLRKRAKHSF